MKKSIPLNKLEALAIDGILFKFNIAKKTAEEGLDEGMKAVWESKGLKPPANGWGLESPQNGKDRLPVAIVWEEEDPPAAPAVAPKEEVAPKKPEVTPEVSPETPSSSVTS